MKYGLPYQGSKNQIAEYIIDNLPTGDRLVDLFGGGGAITHCALTYGKNKFKNVLYNDYDLMVVNYFKQALTGNIEEYTKYWVSREEFYRLKNIDPIIKYCWSFGNNGRGYLYGKNIENYKRDLHNAVVFGDFSGDTFKKYVFLKNITGNTITKRRLSVRNLVKENIECYKKNGHYYDTETNKSIGQLQQLQRLQELERLERLQQLQRLINLKNITIKCSSYLDYEYKEGDVVYCDPPYENTGKYGNQVFNHKDFYNWVYSKPYPIYFSSYEISDNRFFIVDLKQKRSLMNAANKTTLKNEYIYCNQPLKNGQLSII